jgi:hypothetical protein
MFNLFNKKEKKTIIEPIQKLEVKNIDYHPKVILAWAKALEGHAEIATWLNENGYEELVIANAAINLKNEARTWLMQNGYPHLMAMIHGAEGDLKAQKWLLANNFELLYFIAMAVENEQEAWNWIKQNATQDIFLLTQTIKKVKDKIEETHNDIHSFGKD